MSVAAFMELTEVSWLSIKLFEELRGFADQGYQ